MKDLVILWDPENPIVPATRIVGALREHSEVRVREFTFSALGHPTLPNEAFRLRSVLGGTEPDAILWFEGGPLPGDLAEFQCPKACWLVNTALEPTLFEHMRLKFDRVFSASLRDTAEELATWLPPAGDADERFSLPEGISLLLDDPKPPAQSEWEAALADAVRDCGPVPLPVVVALGNGGRVHPLLLDCLGAGAAVLADPDSDLRGIAHAGEHLAVLPAVGDLPGFLRSLLGDADRLKRFAERGPAIVGHLHEPAMRADRIVRGFWPDHRVLSGERHHPRISILVTCFRYLRRFRICLESLARQELPSGSLEIVVADPGSPDGLADGLAEFARNHPELRVVHLPLDPRYHRNRGVGINRAFEVSRGEIVIGIDGDLVFPPTLVGFLSECVLKSPDRIFGVRRSFVGKDETEKILCGEIDPLAEFDRLSGSEGDGEEKSFVGVLGYCQAVHRTAFAKARYPEELDMVNQSDIVFVERLTREAGVRPHYLPDRTVLHLWHPRNWAGTSEFL